MQMSWQQFVTTAPAMMPVRFLAAIVGQPEKAVRAARNAVSPPASDGTTAEAAFLELFARWHGRAPKAEDWPVPNRAGGAYRWLPPEDELLASLVGRVDKGAIASVLTARLQKITGDQLAVRTPGNVQQRINRIGMVSTDLVGALTVQAAGDEVGSVEIVRNAIRAGTLAATRIGRLIAIPHENWAAWKAGRTLPPAGYVPLASLREPLGIRSDSKLPEFASFGYVPTAVQCHPIQPGVHGTSKNGTWYIDAEVGRRLVADRRAGRPMPWHGKPLRDNLRVTWRRLSQRRHPDTCATCASIWGPAGAPVTFEDYAERYPPLAHGAKRHLTRPWTLGLTAADVALQAGRTEEDVRAAIAAGALRATGDGDGDRITRTDATRWIARRCPTGDGRSSWISVAAAEVTYGFSRDTLTDLVAQGLLRTKRCENDADDLVLRQQLAEHRESIGYSEQEAAQRLGVSVPALRELLEGVHWRQAGLIPLATLQAVDKRIKSQQGHTIEEAAELLERTVDWVRARIHDGTIRITRARWDRRRLYVTGPMLERLRAAAAAPPPEPELSTAWIPLRRAAMLAGVCTTTLLQWFNAGEIRAVDKGGHGRRYARVSVMARSRQYWQTVRHRRLQPPAWLQAEIAAGAAP